MNKINGVIFVSIPYGNFLRGSISAKEEQPIKEIYLDSYYISKYPVTMKQYKCFLDETGYRDLPNFGNSIFTRDEAPVVGVSWYDAMEFCKWFSYKNNVDCTLPSEAQWEKSSRGPFGNQYPWGNEPPQNDLLNINGYVGSTTIVGSYPKGASYYGCEDQLGNMWEWCSDWYDEDYYSYSESINPLGPVEGTLKSIRGGSWRSNTFRATCAHRCFYHPNVRSDRHGFRIVLLGDRLDDN